jgi:hypothetical protein
MQILSLEIYPVELELPQYSKEEARHFRSIASKLNTFLEKMING